MKKIKNFILKNPVGVGALILVCIFCFAWHANSELTPDPENPHVNVKANDITVWGKTGLGTDDPLARLHVLSSNAPVTILDLNNATDWLTMDFRRQGERTASFGVSASDAYGGNAFVLGSYKEDWTNPLVIEQGAPTNSLYIRSNGNVGIGLTNPSAKLHVAGGALIIGGKLELGPYGSGSQGNVRIEEGFIRIPVHQSAGHPLSSECQYTLSHWGRMIYATNTNKVYICTYNGWKWVSLN